MKLPRQQQQQQRICTPQRTRTAGLQHSKVNPSVNVWTPGFKYELNLCHNALSGPSKLCCISSDSSSSSVDVAAAAELSTSQSTHLNLSALQCQCHLLGLKPCITPTCFNPLKVTISYQSCLHINYCTASSAVLHNDGMLVL